jgi:shikimate dehydrogenase
MKIDQNTTLYGVIGKPVRHSLGPVMHNAAFLEIGINAVYLAFEVEDVKTSIQGMVALGIKGLSVTIPFKSEVIPFLDEIDPLAGRIGAVNTIVNRGGRLKGYNTDATGAVKALEEKIALKGLTSTIIGAGGAARAIGFSLKEKGVGISIANRSPERGGALARVLDCPYMPLDRIGRNKVDLLVQTTPVGMFPHTGASPVSEDIFHKDLVAMDIIYNPRETTFLKMARGRGAATIDGLGMFVHQGAEQFLLWTGVNPPFEIMYRAVESRLREEVSRRDAETQRKKQP